MARAKGSALLAHLTPVERECLSMLRALATKLGREPTPEEVGAELGLNRIVARAHVQSLIDKGEYVPIRKLTKQQRHCLQAIDALTRRLGRSPSTREVSAEMGMSPGGSRFHIDNLVKLGLLTPPEMMLVMHITDAGKKFL